MSKITYLLGAGASIGDWGDANIPIKEKRGVPVINKFVDSIEVILSELSVLRNSFNAYMDKTNLNQDSLIKLYSVFCELLHICKEYLTIDTYARQLNVSGKSDYKIINDYDTLKRVVSAFILITQDPKRRDIRYDGFIASLIKDDNTFPAMTILSWNYDAQFEMAYAGYSQSGEYIPAQWKELNVLNKTFPTDYNSNRDVSIIKLNGTAFFTDAREKYKNPNGEIYSKLIDNYFGESKLGKYELAYEVLYSKNYMHYQTSLSYAWERDNNDELLEKVQARVIDTEELIVIGYSFPYVNREVDKKIIQSMKNLKTIIIQDPEFDDIKERVTSMLMPAQHIAVKCLDRFNKKQFYLPNSFE